MTFNSYISNYIGSPMIHGSSPKSSPNISIYPISQINVEGIKILVDNCMRMGSGQSNNVQIATIDPSLWLGDFLDKHFDKIKFVTLTPNFSITKIEANKVVEKFYKCINETFSTEKEIDDFFNKNEWKTFVIFSVVKIADLSTMKTSYNLRYSDITEKFEERDNKINNILNGTNNN